MNKIKLVKFIDRILGKLLLSCFPETVELKRETLPDVRNILLIRPGGIGDAVLLIPSITALRNRFPEATIDVLCEKRNAEIFGLAKEINSVYLYDRGIDLYRLLKNKYDVVIDTEQWHRLSAVVAYFTRAQVRIGFETNERSRLFTHRVPYSHDEYEVYSFFHLVEPLLDMAPSFDIDRPFISISDGTGSILPKEMGTGNAPIAIFPGASVAERRLGGDNFGIVAHVLSEEGYAIVILGSHADRDAAKKIREHAPGAIDLTGKTNLLDVTSLLKKCRLLLTADSGLLHIAYAVGTPTVSLFGSGIEKKWAPPGKRHSVINKHLACSPCTRFGYTPRCDRKIKCLNSVSPEEVIKAVHLVL